VGTRNDAETLCAYRQVTFMHPMWPEQLCFRSVAKMLRQRFLQQKLGVLEKGVKKPVYNLRSASRKELQMIMLLK